MFAGIALDAAVKDSQLIRKVPYMQAQLPIDECAIGRLRAALVTGGLQSDDFRCLSTGVTKNAPDEALAQLLMDVAELDGGVLVALDILHMHFHTTKSDDASHAGSLVVCGRALLSRVEFADVKLDFDYSLRTVIDICLTGEEAANQARPVCRHIRAGLDSFGISYDDVGYLIEGVFKAQPEVALDEFLLGGPAEKSQNQFGLWFQHPTPLEHLSAATICNWADNEPDVRYALVGDALSIFVAKEFEEPTDISPLFIEIMDRAPDKATFLGDARRRLHPTGWTGSLAGALGKRRSLLTRLASHPDPTVQEWVAGQSDWLNERIAAEQERESREEESFE